MPSHYLNQCWVIVNWTLRNKLHWNFNWNKNFSFTKMHLKVSSAKWRPFCPERWVKCWGYIYMSMKCDIDSGNGCHLFGAKSSPEKWWLIISWTPGNTWEQILVKLSNSGHFIEALILFSLIRFNAKIRKNLGNFNASSTRGLSYLHNGISRTGNMASLYWIWAQCFTHTGPVGWFNMKMFFY